MSDDPGSSGHEFSGIESSGYSQPSPNQPASQDSGSFYVKNTGDDRGRHTAPIEQSEPFVNERLHEGDDLSNGQEVANDQADDQATGQDGYIKLPSEGASEEEVDAFYAALGVPETPDGYELQVPEELSSQHSDEDWKAYTGAISELSHALGLSPEQAQALADMDLQAKTQSMENMEREQEQYLSQQIEETTQTLSDEWGSKMDVNVRTANRALKALGGSELEGVLSEAGVLNDPVVIRAFHKAGLSLVEDSSPGGAGATRRNKSAAEILYPSSTKEG
ncbi:hypothetical protein WH96_06310 [Kiloniella spongiae]|uniref:Uncharacterized protein n=1 Tax=Kiloniella spongiae TaxID=1489064 RepID=A0A0H2MYS3_9PROT|nr:hypothetical protein [Kiloniella spongiae]KLN61885.1 hypothetical protein WH96_06310 [Kiloniella spongiae]